ncbi:hypothetical protein M422DRAFT_196446 [Sphaerobolus stellatus SS14]|uniref:Helitron helicase-like domain-containing protein n=1 Tax=Sphaerobolus stellatus (strain SS14) TaxID=990650 RepID=A0A0C9UD48_SPHS4|nr:hypothetical protein M422DRAFT_196446 [Sphaerobolus stellatus SS14]
MLYHDKRFQIDPDFPLVAFNHCQIKAASLGSFLLTKKCEFDVIAERILSLNLDVLDKIIEKLKFGDKITNPSNEEHKCLDVINDLDHVGSSVEASATTRKFMRKELWSLLAFKGALTWYITFSPADIKHRLALYLANHDLRLTPVINLPENIWKRIADNPAACACFFHYIVEAFLTHIVGHQSTHKGLFGKPSVFYAPVEQQGQLTIHLHMLLWIENSLSPQEIRDKCESGDSLFRKAIIDYMEDLCNGSFITGDMDTVKDRVKRWQTKSEYKDPTTLRPISPPPLCEHMHDSGCPKCIDT